LTDCSSDSIYNNNGCDGGNIWNGIKINKNFLKIKTTILIPYLIFQAFHYIYKNGIVSEMNYPFYSGDINMQV
jgi:hypothetical protein